MSYGIKTPNGQGLYRVVAGPHPAEPYASQFWEVDETIPEGKRRTGWQLADVVVGQQPALDENEQPILDENQQPVMEDVFKRVVVPVLEDIPPPPEPTVPWAISNADLRRGLVEVGINPELITSYLKSLPEDATKWRALTDWEYSNYVERAHPMLDQLAPNFGLTSEDVDNIFMAKPAYPNLG